VRQLNVEIGALMSGLLSALDQLNGTNTIALVPVAVGAAATRGFVSVSVVPQSAVAAAGAGLVGPLVAGAAILGTATELINLASTRATYDAMSLAIGAIQNFFDIRLGLDTEPQPDPARARVGPRTGTKTKTRKSCEDCVQKRILSQAAKRHRETKKILARV
jgi:hypothetical protein